MSSGTKRRRALAEIGSGEVPAWTSDPSGPRVARSVSHVRSDPEGAYFSVQ